MTTDPEVLRNERYVEAGGRSAKLELYYRLKPLMPRRLQLALRRAYAPRQAKRAFPAWPFEPALVEHRDARAAGAARGGRAATRCRSSGSGRSTSATAPR